MDWKMNDLCQLHHCSETYLTCLKTKFSCHCWVIAVKIGLYKWEITIGESSYDMTDAQCWLITPLPPGPISVILKMLECAAVRCAFFPKCHHNPISSVWNIPLIRLGCCSMVSCLQGKLKLFLHGSFRYRVEQRQRCICACDLHSFDDACAATVNLQLYYLK